MINVRNDEEIRKMVNKYNIENNVLPRLRPLKELKQLKEREYVYLPFLDMVVTFYVPMDERHTERLVSTQKVLELTGINTDELYEHAKRNIAESWQMVEIKEMMKNLNVMANPDDTDVPVYVVTANGCICGASVMFSEKIMKTVSGRFGGEMIILPSSVHEVLIMPKTDSYEYETLLSIVRTVNRTEVSEEDFLSDNVYVYKEGNFQIIE